MTLAAASLLALLATIVASCLLPLNPGLVAIALAFLVGHAHGGLPAAQIAAGFPGGLFITLAGVTLLFSQASVNGTLAQLAARSIRLVRGHRGAIPLVFFLLAAAISAVGVGNIGAVALLAPLGMGVASRLRISGFLMTLMLANGGNAGVFSPLSPGGIVARGLMERAGLHGAAWANFANTFVAQTVVAVAGYLLFGGAALFRPGAGPAAADALAAFPAPGPLSPAQRRTVVVIAAVVAAVIFLRADVGMAAFAGAVALTLLRAADEQRAVKEMPWGVIMMVCGLTVLVEVLGRTGGMDLATDLLAKVSAASFAPGFLAAVAGAISVYASSTGVVVPALLALVPGLVARLPGADPLMLAYSINVGALLVDVSPLSTLGALCLAAAGPNEDRTSLYRRLMAWGLAMVLVGGAVCQMLFGLRGG